MVVIEIVPKSYRNYLITMKMNSTEGSKIMFFVFIPLTVISIFIMSPSTKGRSSGIPWHATLFTDVQTDFGNIA